MAQIVTNNSLLSFMSEATTNLQQALSKQGKAKKVNHRKYINKRLQHSGKNSRVGSSKPKQPIQLATKRHLYSCVRAFPAVRASMSELHVSPVDNLSRYG